MIQLTHAILATSLLLGQSDSAPAQPELMAQFIKDFSGTWVSEQEATEDFLDLVKKGDSTRGQSVVKSVLGNQALTANWTYKVNGKVAARGRSLIAYDDETKSIREFGVWNGGGYAESNYKYKDGVWMSKFKAVMPGGARMSATETVTIVDSDTHERKMTNRIGIDGKPQPDETSTHHRVKQESKKEKKE